MKRIAYFLDGTWNEPDDKTNVTRLYAITLNDNGASQTTRYQEGVGSRFGEWLRGGALGWGLSRNACDAYGWLVEDYEDGDEVFLFGFSRGAFTARTLAGMIVRCGLLRQGADLTPEDVLNRYRQGDKVRERYRIAWDVDEGKAPTDEESHLLENSREIEIKFIGVWDTVGALGVPFGRIRGLSRSSFGFHNTYPSFLYKNMLHAIAIDEHRKAFDATLWTKFEPDGAADFSLLRDDQTLEQRWFVGDHGDVGGSGHLATVPLAWMQEEAADCGLEFTKKVVPASGLADRPHGDSFAEFMFGAYRVLKLNQRHRRAIGREPRRTASMAGRSHVVNEVIDPTVFERWRTDSSYRPENLVKWAERRRLDPANLLDAMSA